MHNAAVFNLSFFSWITWHGNNDKSGKKNMFITVTQWQSPHVQSIGVTCSRAYSYISKTERAHRIAGGPFYHKQIGVGVSEWKKSGTWLFTILMQKNVCTDWYIDIITALSLLVLCEPRISVLDIICNSIYICRMYWPPVAPQKRFLKCGHNRRYKYYFIFNVPPTLNL